MKTWIIEPRDPLIVRDGRPFGPIPGARAASLAFPFPSTTTGGVRTRDGLKNGVFDTSAANIDRVKKIAVRGPLLVELDDTGDIDKWCVPAPADALLLDLEPVNSQRAALRQLAPFELPTQASTNLEAGLVPVGLSTPDPRKPCGQAPRYWYWDKFERWLLKPLDEEITLADLGHSGPVQEARTHVSIQPGTQTAAEGALFQTRGLEFTRQAMKTRLALAVATDANNITSGLAPLGGERRLVNWRETQKTLPVLPPTLRTAIVQVKACRVVLLTPAHFRGGSRPEWLTEPRHNVTPELQAVATGRAQVVSGWDFERTASYPHGRPKPTRRLAPAGAVFFLKLDGSDADVEKWIDETWMQCVSDDPQDRCDGFGLAVLGIWEDPLK